VPPLWTAFWRSRPLFRLCLSASPSTLPRATCLHLPFRLCQGRRLGMRHPLLPRWATSPAVSLLSLTVLSQSGRLPRGRLRLFGCAASPAMSLLSLTVLSRSGRLPRGRLCLCGYATSPAVSLLSLTVLSHSGRLPRGRLPRGRLPRGRLPRGLLRLFGCAASPAMSLLSLTIVPQPSSSPTAAGPSSVVREYSSSGLSDMADDLTDPDDVRPVRRMPRRGR
jgi:hypothetical protein